ncbi:hypothetical protein WUBG_17899 [Wuchereria bancrofti]|nr:hypothetical protein WUBG_17899 [Wuchereria bancrofti]
MQYDPLPESGYRIFILVVALNYILCAYLYETGVIEYLVLTVREKWRKKHSVKTDADMLNKNEKILLSISSSPSWIPSATEGSSDHFGLYSFSNSSHIIKYYSPECF